MARKSMTELGTELTTLFPDNSAGEVSPADVRLWCNDLLNALRPVYGQLSGAILSQTFGTTSSKVLFDTAVSSKPDEIVCTAGATSNMVRAERGSMTAEFNVDISLANNVSLTFTLFRNGAAQPWKATGVGRGAGNPVSVSMTMVDYADPAATYHIEAVCENVGTIVTLENMVFIVKLQPVNSY